MFILGVERRPHIGGLDGNAAIYSGNPNVPDLYTVTFNSLSLVGLTGVRLEVTIVDDGDFDNHGHAGFPSGDGNIVLGEFQLFANAVAEVPEPSTYALLGTCLLPLMRYRSQRARQ